MEYAFCAEGRKNRLPRIKFCGIVKLKHLRISNQYQRRYLMKRIKTIAAVLGVALLFFAATAMAGESSFYDSNNEWIVRAYTEPTPTSGVDSIFVEILKEDGTYFTPTSEILLNGQALTGNPFLIDSNQVTDEISIAYKYVNGATDIFVFGTEVVDGPAVVHNNRTLSRDWPVPPANISVSGGGSFSNVNVGSSSTSYITVSNTGEAALTLNSINVTGTSFSRNGGTCGTTVTGGNSCTVGVKFEPASATSYSGTLTILSNDGDTPTSTVALTGTGAALPSGTIDIGFPSYGALDGASVVCNGLPFVLTVNITNKGTLPSGPFAVKVYLSLNKSVDSQDIYLGTWDVSNLTAGQTLPYTFSNLMATGLAIHMQYFFLAQVDANNNIPNEISETNNVAYRATSVAR